MQQEFKPLHCSDTWGAKKHSLEKIDQLLSSLGLLSRAEADWPAISYFSVMVVNGVPFGYAGTPVMSA